MTNSPHHDPSGHLSGHAAAPSPNGYPPAYGPVPRQPQPYGWTPAAAAMAPYGYGRPPAPAKSGNRLVIWSIVGAVAALLLLVIAPVLVIGKVSHDLGNSMESLTGGRTQQILDDDLDVTLGTFSRDTSEYLDGGTLKVTLKNKSDERSTFVVEVEAVTSSGERITTASEYANSLGAGQTLNDELRFMVSGDQERELANATFNVISVTKF